ncbi:hypothetical protein ASF00_00910 [Sphingomonas sp. Leaf34]|uniref:hypothetical protein n=1 Tax=Sphingomonas sp. Leaf34 TaxID=1736216 RepID=UPI0006F56451|nr:hypothetical protein [Sphingomonas sp. Leaf34]KQN31400.1 hypothetical protein ASF00_00910 [Sphingomonas sp. Leaf34]
MIARNPGGGDDAGDDWTELQRRARPNEDLEFLIGNNPDLAPLAAAMRKQFDPSFMSMDGIFGSDCPFNRMAGILDRGSPLVFLGMKLDAIDHARLAEARSALPASPILLDAVGRDLATTP